MKIDTIFVSKSALNFPLTKEILKGREYKISNLEEIRALLREKRIKRERTLFISTFPGNFIKDCPCTPGYVSCGYKNINFAYNCPLNCSYCILQEYLTYPVLTLFVNLDKLKDELIEYRKHHKHIRIGTGELTDSLIWEKLYPFSRWFISLFEDFEDIIFEFKTKTDYIENFPILKNNKNILVSFSINPPELKKEELHSPIPKKRMKAMKELSEIGYGIGIHFDPIIHYKSWKEDYEDLIKELFKHIPPKKIGWISLGSLRFTKELRWEIKKNHPQSELLKGELIEGFDKKYRYPYFLRVELYSQIIKYLKKYGSTDLPLYFCMESEEMWKELLDLEPTTHIINEYLYEKAKRSIERKP